MHTPRCTRITTLGTSDVAEGTLAAKRCEDCGNEFLILTTPVGLVLIPSAPGCAMDDLDAMKERAVA